MHQILPRRFDMQTRSTDMSYANFMRSTVYAPQIYPAPFYPRSPYGLSGLGQHGTIPGPPYCTDFASYQDLLNYFNVEDCTTYDAAMDVAGSYACVQRNAPKLVSVANFQAECSYPANYGPSGGGIVPVNLANPPAGGGTGFYYAPTSGQPIGNPYPQAGGGSAPSSGATGGSYSPRVSFSGSRQGSTFYPGDTWQVQITGGQPSTMVTVNGVHNGAAATNPMGTTDANGNFTMNGSFDSSVIGNWTETWYVGTQSAGSFSFQVIQPTTAAPSSGGGATSPSGSGGSTSSYPSPGQSAGGTQSGSPSPTPSGNPAPTPATSGDLLPGISNTYLAIGAGALLLILVAAGGR